ncbi:hypothetical protein PAECIP112173_00769 [Paenibacillus sp. JJ-100]|uniref:hypothetical protein n=1 Tax=Paenibacillus sp. JJ-100 TaxID=2974896 RepID=UPI0022FF9273|nr:hypothetical protein [Paenibacillus sp. JJ-100]CAI6034583.1 hypothetical protein PAECIP112173_00769 [Paenibacillus sp. JJ-100]
MILTVYSGREEGEWFDIEVPDECTIEHLKTLLGVRIFGQAPGDGIQYILEAKFPEGLWFTPQNTQQLMETGLRQGSCVRVQRAFSTTSEEAPIYGRRSLFQQESNES